MASGAASSRRTKRIPAEHRGRRKNSNKSLKRRRVSSSPSSYFSDSNDDYRNRRRRVDSRRKPEKRRGREKKRSENRKSRRFRGRNVSSSWDSSSSCSTCRSRSIDSLGRSRSPVRHQEFKKGKRKIRSRGRKLDRGRKMSSSCSTCSGSSSWSWSSGRRQSCREGRRREKGDLGQKGKRREKDDVGLRGSSVMDDTLGDGEGKYGSEDKETNTQMNNKNYDSLKAAGGIVEHNFGRVEQDEMMDPGYYDQATETDRWMDEGKVEKDFYFGQFEDSSLGRQEAHSSESYQCGKSYFEGSDGSHTYEFKYNSETGRRIKSEVVVVDKIGSESDDLELLLRQKALENLKKLREEQSVNNRSSAHEENNSDGDVCSEKPCIAVKSSIAASESGTISEKDVLVGAPLHESKVNSFTEQLANKASDDYNPDKQMMFTSLSTSRSSKLLDKDNIISQSASVGTNSGREIPKKISSEQTPNGGSQEKASSAAECGTNLRLNEGEKIRGSHENMDTEKKNGSQENVDGSGSQFEQKTFSRVHDGEMVQVSYKVYIPKKTPALARRKLQR